MFIIVYYQVLFNFKYAVNESFVLVNLALRIGMFHCGSLCLEFPSIRVLGTRIT